VALIGSRGYPSYYGGFETLVRRLAPHLADSGWDVTVYGRGGATRPDDPLRDPRVRTRSTFGLETRSLSTLSFGCSSSLHTLGQRPDVALVMNVANGFWLPLLRSRRIPTVVNVDGIEWEREKWGSTARAVFRQGARMAARFGDTLVYDAEAIRDYWIRTFDRDGAVIPYGGEAPGRTPVPAGLVHRRYALMVARFVPENTVAEFLEAAPYVAEVTDVVIVGSSGYGGALEARAAALAAENDRIHWFGHLSDDERLHALWQHAGVYFHGHSVGGTNPALVQAMACGAPTVARDTVYNREVMDGAGVVVPPSVDGIREALLAVLSDAGLQERLSSAAQQRAARAYRWPDVCTRYGDALLAAAESRG
jgi:glycosyltransferase involved in cell wall biosynthesis